MAEANLSLDSMGGFVYYSLSKILKESSKSRDKQLRTVAIDIQKQIFQAFQKNPEEARADRNGDKYFLPFNLACNYERPNIKMLHTSLDAIQRMIAYGYLSGDSFVDPKIYPPIDLDPQSKSKSDKKDSIRTRKRRLIDVLVETIFKCSTMIDDDQVQIQVIKTLITAVTSKSCHVHDHSILLAVRSCYHIYLTARNSSNQTTARAILTQMLNVVFRRMETFAQQLQEVRLKAAPREVKIVLSPPPSEKPEGEESKDKKQTADSSKIVKEIVGGLVNKVAKDEEGAAEIEDSKAPPANSTDKKGKNSKPTAAPPLKDRPLPAPGTSEVQNLERQLIIKLSIMQNDAYLLFRALTQLSMKKLPESIDPVAIKSKALALELLLSVIQNSGPMLRTHSKFVGFIKDKLVRSLLQNCVSPIPRIYKMAAPMFLALVAQFKPQMKYEIGVILNNIFLNMLASPMSSYMQKSMAVVILLKLCKDPQTIVELFLNFDCDISSEDKIFEAIIIQLEKVAQGRFMSEALMSPQNESALRLNALEALGHVMTSLITWCSVLKKGEEDAARTRERKESQDRSLDDDNASRHSDDVGRAGASSSSSTTNRPAFSQQFNLQRERRALTEKAILLFNRKPKKGIKFLEDHGILQKDAKAVAEFLKTHKKLDKTQIGEYLGEDKDFNKEVRYKYIEDLDFTGMQFDEALRYFLKDFRLPGEGQKIDRLVVKFADQYTTNNPFNRGGKFRTADGAYVLAYATIMLHTDLHNPGVKNKMSKDQFINMNRGIDDGNDIDPTFMSHLYDKIQQEEIHMTGGDSAPSEWQNAATLNPRKRQTMFQKQTESLIKQTENLIRTKKPKRRSISSSSSSILRQQQQHDTKKSAAATAASTTKNDSHDVSAPNGTKTSDDAGESSPANNLLKDAAASAAGGGAAVGGHEDEWYDATHADLDALQPMFDLLWCPAFATFSLVLKENDEPKVAKLCLDNYNSAVRLSSIFAMDTPRDAFVKSLQHFSLLGTIKPLGFKNVEAIKTLLHIAYADGDYLKDSWKTVLQCISEYDKLMRRSPAAQTPVDVFDSGTSGAREAKKRGKKSIQRAVQIHHQNAEILREQLDPALVDRVFTHSAHLNSEAIVDFVRNLTQVSQSEVYTTNNETPRVFSLQKIVEITYYNMNRIRLVWSRIWNILSAYFAKAGCHPNLQVSLYSIDSLRQLAMKFLEKDELAHYHFQKQFLQPFEDIMANTKSQESKALIIQCISRMVLGRVANVRSGWKSVFIVLRIAANDRDKSLVTAAFALQEKIMVNYFTLISKTLQECVLTLGTFARNSFTNISLKSLDYIAKCAAHLAKECSVEGGPEVKKEKKNKKKKKKKKQEKEAVGDEEKKRKIHEEKEEATSEGKKQHQLPPIRRENSEEVLSSSFPVWMTIFKCYSTLLSDNRFALQNRALEVLFATLSEHGDLFTVDNWKKIFTEVLFPVFNSVGSAAATTPPSSSSSAAAAARSQRRGGGGPSSKPPPPPPPASASQEWLKTTCLKAMTKVVQIFAQYQDTIQEGLLPQVLALIQSCISQGNLELAKIGIQCWEQLMSVSGAKFDDGNWTLVLNSLHALFEQTLPHELQAPRLRKSMGLPAKSPRRGLGGRGGASSSSSTTTTTTTTTAATTSTPPTTTSTTKSTASGVSAAQNKATTPTPSTKNQHNKNATTANPLPNGQDTHSPAPRPPATTTATSTSTSTAEKKKAMIRTDLLSYERVVVKCIVNHLLMETSFSTFQGFYNLLKQEHVEQILAALKSTIAFLSTFNSDLELQKKLYQVGFKAEDGGLFKLMDQEVEAYGYCMQMLQIMYRGSNPNFDDSKAADIQLRETGERIFKRYINNKIKMEGKRTKESVRLAKVVSSLIEGFDSYSENQIKANMPTFFPRMLDIIEHGDLSVRRMVAKFMRKRITPLLPFAVEEEEEDQNDNGSR